MRRNSIFLLLGSSILLFALLALPISADGGQTHGQANTSGDLLAALLRLGSASQDVLAITAEFAVALVNSSWQATPEPLRCLYGLLVNGFLVLAVIGVIALWSIGSFWLRHFS